jgi:hypothetical protein
MAFGIKSSLLRGQKQFDSELLASHGLVMPKGIWHQMLASQGPGNSLTLNHWQGMVQGDAK